MGSSGEIQRVVAVLEGRRPDRVPVSFWHHFDRTQSSGPAAVRAHLDWLAAYDLDFLKVMNDNGYPSPGPIRKLKDLAALTVLNGDEPAFAKQLRLIRALAGQLSGRVLMATTLFNAWATLRRLVRTTEHQPGPPRLNGTDQECDRLLSRFLAEDRQAVARALETVGRSLARFAARCLEAGADGVFLSVRDDWVDTEANGRGTYDQLVRSTDLEILEAASAGRFNLLHVCGCAANFDAFAQYPVHAINWADRSAGPSIAEVRDRLKPALCAGVDNLELLPNGRPEQCADQVRDAIAQAGARPILIAPGCTFDPLRVRPANLHAVCRAAREA